MKAVLITLFSILTIGVYAGEGTKIANAIQSSNTNELATMFNTSIELVTPGTSGVHSKDQAKIVLDNFFTTHQPVKATVTHETNGTTNSMIVIQLQTKSGNYRISVSGTYNGKNFIINEFKIV